MNNRSEQELSFSVGIYARLSVNHHDQKNESIASQIEIAKAYLNGRPDFRLYDCYVDLGKSGMNFERDAFKRLLEDIKKHRVNCIVVKDFSRFGRNHIESGHYIEKIFPFLGVRFISVTDHFDSFLQPDQDELLSMNLKNLANEMYAKDIGRRIKSAKELKKQQGSYMGGRPPYGFRIQVEGALRLLVPEKEEMSIVQEIFHQYSGGKSISQIAQLLYEREIHRPTEYHTYGHIARRKSERLYRWSVCSIKGMLANPVYCGLAEYEQAAGRLNENKKTVLREECKKSIPHKKSIPGKECSQSLNVAPQQSERSRQQLTCKKSELYRQYRLGKLTAEQYEAYWQLLHRRGNFPSP